MKNVNISKILQCIIKNEVNQRFMYMFTGMPDVFYQVYSYVRKKSVIIQKLYTYYDTFILARYDHSFYIKRGKVQSFMLDLFIFSPVKNKVHILTLDAGLRHLLELLPLWKFSSIIFIRIFVLI